MVSSDGTDEPAGRLGAVLRSVGVRGPVALGRHGPWLVTTLEDARRVLTSPDVFDFPNDVSRRPLAADGENASARSLHSITPPLAADQVAVGRRVFADELAVSTLALDLPGEVDAMWFLREPVSRSTTAAVLPGLDPVDRDRIAALVVLWIDALGPVIAASSPPRRWSRRRRNEERARLDLEGALAEVACPDPPGAAVVLAAGVQVPIAAGAWLLVQLAEDSDLQTLLRQRADLDSAVAWETVRLRPPTWITARVTRQETDLGPATVPASMVVLVSPLLLGRLGNLVPGPDDGLGRFDPLRWDQDRVRPGAWLPFGAGPHACPGRNLGLAQLTHLAGWAREVGLTPVEPSRINQTRGIFPEPARLHVDRPRTQGD